ncbi:MAG TPA: 2'-5' RNA ligase family protein [Ferruginibacter sp.]|nr:2'-5' RNA ligase family protein [Ferruginibacter sp.]HPH91797.1 2'-5' RNA ligase family protein [Ferruginibacter sp.]
METAVTMDKKPASLQKTKADLSKAMPGYKVYEYQLVLHPHEELWNRIVKVKNEFAEKYQHEQAKWGKPHLTLVSFIQYEMMEAKIINRLKVIAMGAPPVKIELKDFGSFPSHTIYINITSKIPVQGLVKKIRTDTQRLMKLNEDNKPHFMMEPYVAVARKLQPWQYEKGWLEYSHKHFTGRFIASDMLLLKRSMFDKKYEIAQRFEFENLPVNTTQGDLFGTPVPSR